MLVRIGYVSGAITTEKRPLNVFQYIPCDQKQIPKWLREWNKNKKPFKRMKKKNHLPSIHLRRSAINFYHFEIVQLWFDEHKMGQRWRMKGKKEAKTWTLITEQKRKKSSNQFAGFLNNSKQKFVSVLIDFQVLRFIFRLLLFGMKSPEVIFKLKQSYRQDRRKILRIEEKMSRLRFLVGKFHRLYFSSLILYNSHSLILKCSALISKTRE